MKEFAPTPQPRFVQETMIVYRRSKEQPISKCVTSPEIMSEMAAGWFIPDAPEERVVAVGLSSKSRVVCWTTLGIGSISACPVDMAHLVRWSCLSGVTFAILVHNHPSGDVSPSAEDIAITERAEQALDLVGITLRDHIIIGWPKGKLDHFSFVTAGLLGQ